MTFLFVVMVGKPRAAELPVPASSAGRMSGAPSPHRDYREDNISGRLGTKAVKCNLQYLKEMNKQKGTSGRGC